MRTGMVHDDEVAHMDLVLPDPDEKLRAEGWRLHVFCEYEGGNVLIASERVLPEKVSDPRANRVIDSRRIRLHPDEVTWLVDRFAELLSRRASLDLVREFHQRFEQADAAEPVLDNEATNELRLKLIREETKELEEALAARDPVAALDALTDIQYVLDGTYLQLGFAKHKDAALAEVHRSNMSKLGADGRPVKRDDGKIVKGPNYSPPNLTALLSAAKGLGDEARAAVECVAGVFKEES